MKWTIVRSTDLGFISDVGEQVSMLHVGQDDKRHIIDAQADTWQQSKHQLYSKHASKRLATEDIWPASREKGPSDIINSVDQDQPLQDIDTSYM